MAKPETLQKWTRATQRLPDFSTRSDNEVAYAQLARIVNPDNASLRVLYAGSGGDLLTPLLTTNSDRFVYVDENGLDESYGGYPNTTLDRIREEATQLGIGDLDVQRNGTYGAVNFRFRHAHDTLSDTSRLRHIQFYAADYFAFWPSEFEEGYDVLIVRGEAPSFDDHDIQMRQLSKRMMVGGFFIADRTIVRHINPSWIGFDEIPNGTAFPIGPARVYKKNHLVDENLLSKLFSLDDLIRQLDNYLFSEDRSRVEQMITYLLTLCESLPEEMRVEARLRAGANMRWVGCENWLGDDRLDRLGWFNFAKDLSHKFSAAFSA